MATLSRESESDLISDNATTGMDTDPDLAALKALVEFVERRAFREGQKMVHHACLSERSDGFAAFPAHLPDARKAARLNALCEAVERYTWATWWDHADTAFTQKTADFSGDLRSSRFFGAVSRLMPVMNCVEVKPVIANAELKTIILIAFLEGGGVISGGACTSHNVHDARFRGLCELSRHALAMRRFRNADAEAKTFYEKRLCYFGATEQGERLVRNRLSKIGQLPIDLPPLAIDSIVPHTFEKIAVVHRCLFENQPHFIGGPLERLCL